MLKSVYIALDAYFLQFYNNGIIFAKGVACQARKNEARVTTVERTRDVLQEKLRYAPSRRGYRGGHVAVLLRPLSVAICHSDVCKHARSRGWRRTTCEVITRKDIKRIRQAGKDFRAKSSTRQRGATSPSILGMINKSPKYDGTCLSLERKERDP